MSKLVPTEAFNRRIAELIATSVGDNSLNSDPCSMILTTNEFTANAALKFADLQFATFTGSGLIGLGNDVQQVIRSRDDASWGIGLRIDSTPRYLVCTTAPTIPEVITGVAVVGDSNNLLAALRFADPITIRIAGDYVEIPVVFGFLPPEPFAAS